ncbi:hypothetical protein [Streptomyces flavofungini]|uniref:hypothetical protein n=1 Tax=Streptomyces flavofungini TaxID=68200 RepID=UPI0025AED890|nr:hypothetical protein [Streptomyces flavofungini]WJV46082.1 hypothetical protein QUY26_11395 [Streptomyces flavofungini]
MNSPAQEGRAGPGGADSSGPGLALVAAAGAAGVSAAACFDPAGGPGVPRLSLLGWALGLAAGAVLARRGGFVRRSRVAHRGAPGPRGGDLRPVVAAALLVLGTALLCAGGGGAAAAAVAALCVCGAGAGFVGVAAVAGTSAGPGAAGASRVSGVSGVGGAAVSRYAALVAVALAAGVLAAAWWLPQARGAAGVLACAAGLLYLARAAPAPRPAR